MPTANRAYHVGEVETRARAITGDGVFTDAATGSTPFASVHNGVTSCKLNRTWMETDGLERLASAARERITSVNGRNREIGVLLVHILDVTGDVVQA